MASAATREAKRTTTNEACQRSPPNRSARGPINASRGARGINENQHSRPAGVRSTGFTFSIAIMNKKSFISQRVKNIRKPRLGSAGTAEAIAPCTATGGGVCGDGSRWGARLTYIEQAEPLGLAHAVMVAEPFLGRDSFVMYLGDNLLKSGIGVIPKKMADNRADCVISLMPVKEPQRYGIAELSPDGKEVLRTVEKPKEPKSNLAVIGVYAFNSTFFDIYPKLKPSWRNEMEITVKGSLVVVVLNGLKVIDTDFSKLTSVIGTGCARSRRNATSGRRACAATAPANAPRAPPQWCRRAGAGSPPPSRCRRCAGSCPPPATP